MGLDFSGEVLQRLEGFLQGREEFNKVDLRQGQAHQLDFMADDAVDLVIINSVAQYFPGVDYLLQVLREAVRVTKPGGHIFVGDVRSLPLLEAYYASVERHRAGAEMPSDELRRRIARAAQQDEELAVDPELFHALGRSWEKLGRVEVALKRGDYDNELSRFRYDVTLGIGPKEQVAEPERWVEWDEAGAWQRAIAAYPTEATGVRGVVDRRVEVMRLADQLGVELSWQHFDSEGVYDVIYRPQWESRQTSDEATTRDFARFANTPAQVAAGQQLGRVLQEHLRQSLPDYMVPAAVLTVTGLAGDRQREVRSKRLAVARRKARRLPRTAYAARAYTVRHLRRSPVARSRGA